MTETGMNRSMSDDCTRQLFALYDSVDAEVKAAGPQCQASGRCCRFKEYGHTLFVSELEARALLDSAPAYSTPVSPDFCPFQSGNLCTARSERPLGCRIYFCDPAYQDTGNQIMEKHLRILKKLADEYKLDWRYAPLHIFLNEAQEPVSSLPPGGSRIPLLLAQTSFQEG